MEFTEVFNQIFEQMQSFFSQYWVIMAIVSAVVGLLHCFFGFKLYKIFIAIGGFLIFGCVGAGIGYAINDSVIWYAVGGAVIGAVLGAFLAYKLYMIGVFFMCLIGGVIIAAAALNFIENTMVYFAAIAAVGIVCGILGVVLTKHFIIIITGFSGASMIVGNVLTIMERSDDMMISAIGTLVIGLIGVIFQYAIDRRKKEIEEANSFWN